jgi:hypothetical protein
VKRRVEGVLFKVAYALNGWISETLADRVPGEWRQRLHVVLAEQEAEGRRVAPRSAAVLESWMEWFIDAHGLPLEQPVGAGATLDHVEYASAAGTAVGDPSSHATQVPLSTRDPLDFMKPLSPADQEKLDELNLAIDHERRKQHRQRQQDEELFAQGKNILWAVAGIIYEPIDWAMTADQIASEPKRPASYAGLLPFVPATTGKIFRTMDKGGEIAGAAARAGSVSKRVPNPHGKLGGPAHRAAVAARADELEAQGHKIVAGGGRLPEQALEIPGGGLRFPDISTVDPAGVPYYENIGKTTKAGRPIARESRALKDIERAAQQPPGFTRLIGKQSTHE